MNSEIQERPQMSTPDTVRLVCVIITLVSAIVTAYFIGRTHEALSTAREIQTATLRRSGTFK